MASTTASNLTAGGSWVGYLTVPASPAGSYAVTASCFFSAKADLQDYNFVPFALTATPVATTTSLASSANPATYGQPVTLTATVTPQGAGTPTGTADFFSGTSGIGSASLNGVNPDRASVTIAAGTPGTYSFMAGLPGRCRLHRLHLPAAHRNGEQGGHQPGSHEDDAVGRSVLGHPDPLRQLGADRGPDRGVPCQNPGRLGHAVLGGHRDHRRGHLPWQRPAHCVAGHQP